MYKQRRYGRSYADPEIAGRRRDLKWNLHRLIHCDHFQGTRADSEQARNRPRPKHEGETGLDAMNRIFLEFDAVAIFAIQVETSAHRIGRNHLRLSAVFTGSDCIPDIDTKKKRQNWRDNYATSKPGK